jgi:hypothetical protein
MNKKIFWIILIPALLIIGGYLFIRFSLQSSINKGEKDAAAAGSDTTAVQKSSPLDLRPLFIKKLQQVVTKSSGGLYTLSVADMQLDVLASSVSLQNVSVIPDKEVLASLVKEAQAPNDVFTVSFKTLIIEGVNLDDAITSKTMDYKLIKLVNPIIEVHHKKRTTVKKSDEDFSQRFLKEMQKLSVNKVVIEGAALTHYNDDKKGKQTKLNDFALTMTDILVDSTTRDNKDRFLFAKEAAISFKNFSTATTDKIYNLEIGSVSIKSPRQTVSLQNFSFKTKLSKEAFQKRFKTRKEIFDLSIPSITVQKMDWWDLLNEERIEADAITVSGLKLDVYLDRRPLPSSRMGNFPNQVIMNMPIKISVPKIKFENMEVAYTEFNPKSKQNGTVVLDRINMTMTGVTNRAEKMGATKKMNVSASARFMRTVPLNAVFNLDMKAYKKGAFSAALSLGGFDGTIVNSFAGPMGMVNVKEGSLQKVEIKVSGDEMKATSEVLVLYKNLKVSLLEKDSGKKALDKKDVTSFLANFIIKNDNPKGDKEPRRERGEFVRNPDAGFLNLVWKAGLVGILKTVGAPAKLASKP